MNSLRHAVITPMRLVARTGALLAGLLLASTVTLPQPAQAAVGGGPLRPSPPTFAEGDADLGGPRLPATGAWFGAQATRIEGEEAFGEEAHLAFEELIGRKIAVKRVYHQWEDEFPTENDEWVRDQGTILIMSWTSAVEGVPVAYWRDIANGMHDDLIDTRAADIKAFGAPLFFTFHQEPEWGDSQTGTSEEFVWAWQRIHDRFEAAGVTNVSWVLILTSFTYTAGAAEQWYPGDEYVDLLGADGYDWFTCPLAGGREDFEPTFEAFHEYGVAKGKPMIIPEWGAVEDPDDPGAKAAWFEDARSVLKSWPEIKAVSYYHNDDDDCDWWVDTSEQSLDAFTAMGADPYFNPPPPLIELLATPDDVDDSLTASFEFTSNVPVSTFTCALDGGPGVACLSPYTYVGLSQGDHEATITATDPGSGLKSSIVYPWTVDTIAPTMEITWGPYDYTNDPNAAFGVASDEQGEGMFLECSLDGAMPSECEVPIEYRGLADGPHTFVATATDGAGNVSPPATWEWTVDRIAPVVTIASGPASLTNSKTATFTMTSNEIGSTFICSLDGGRYVGCSSPKTYNWLADGTHTFSAKAQDLAKNRSAPKSWTWTVDATKPTVTITSGPGDGPSASVTFGFTASEGSVTFTCQLDTGAKTTCTSPKTYSDVALGQHTLSVYATDVAGNVSRTKKWSWRRT
jgi:hypothetical protein